MRVIREWLQEEIRISLFSWNNKYIIKFELGPMEQTFKVPEMDVLDQSELETFWKGDFFEKVKTRFHEMGTSFREELIKL
ncbi:hypothetical protein [Algoriphagus sediminis]|uniref:KTSC domain-containing protein n=1 Tax=Algoriphagus sediminis TaxID=3057113 RepID=A0ABT7YAT9_9BACT|nr:hypothetical protein [Algoriphagus sediminis]MDN3203520.1 hypothetical protein [Algoriphagus sediminis]